MMFFGVLKTRDGARDEMLGEGTKNCQSADSEQREQIFYGPHLSDGLKCDYAL